MITRVEGGRKWELGWWAEECKLYVEGTQCFTYILLDILDSNWTFAIQYWRVAMVLFLCITNSYFFKSIGGHFGKGKTKNELSNMGGYLISFELHIQFLSFSNGKHTFVIIHFGRHTFPNVSRFF